MSKMLELLKKTDWQKLYEEHQSRQHNQQSSGQIRDALRELDFIEAAKDYASQLPDVQNNKPTATDTRPITLVVPASCTSFSHDSPSECHVTLSASDIEQIISTSMMAGVYGFKSISLGFREAKFCVKRTGKMLCDGKEHNMLVFPPEDDGRDDMVLFRVEGMSNAGDIANSGLIELPTRFIHAPQKGLEWLSQHHRCVEPAAE